jgi:hypothetical protein
VTQVFHLLDLAPEIQAYLDALAPSGTRVPLTERRLPDIARTLDPDDQVAELEQVAGVRLPRVQAAANVRPRAHEAVDRPPGAV